MPGLFKILSGGCSPALNGRSCSQGIGNTSCWAGLSFSVFPITLPAFPWPDVSDPSSSGLSYKLSPFVWCVSATWGRSLVQPVAVSPGACFWNHPNKDGVDLFSGGSCFDTCSDTVHLFSVYSICLKFIWVWVFPSGQGQRHKEFKGTEQIYWAREISDSISKLSPCVPVILICKNQDS